MNTSVMSPKDNSTTVTLTATTTTLSSLAVNSTLEAFSPSEEDEEFQFDYAWIVFGLMTFTSYVIAFIILFVPHRPAHSTTQGSNSYEPAAAPDKHVEEKIVDPAV